MQIWCQNVAYLHFKRGCLTYPLNARKITPKCQHILENIIRTCFNHTLRQGWGSLFVSDRYGGSPDKNYRNQITWHLILFHFKTKNHSIKHFFNRTHPDCVRRLWETPDGIKRPWESLDSVRRLWERTYGSERHQTVSDGSERHQTASDGSERHQTALASSERHQTASNDHERHQTVSDDSEREHTALKGTRRRQMALRGTRRRQTALKGTRWRQTALRDTRLPWEAQDGVRRLWEMPDGVRRFWEAPDGPGRHQTVSDVLREALDGSKRPRRRQTSLRHKTASDGPKRNQMASDGSESHPDGVRRLWETPDGPERNQTVSDGSERHQTASDAPKRHQMASDGSKLFAFVTMIFAIFWTMSMVSLNKISTHVLEHLTLPYSIRFLGYEACCARSHRAPDFLLYSVLVGYGVPDLSPVLIQPSLEGIKGTNPALKKSSKYPKYMPKCSVGSTNYVCNFLPKNTE